jgi:DNA-binding PadR family transcriptional regulator
MENAQGTEKTDAELTILENLYDSARRSAPLRQRQLANAAGASLGMTNAILKRLAQKGWIVIRRLNSRNVQYAITPDGVNEIARRSYRYFKRTIRNVVFYRDLIDETVSRAKLRGLTAVILIGVSDLDFIVEHACDRHGLTFLKAMGMDVAAPVRASGALTVFAEGIVPGDRTEEPVDELYLSTILSGSKEV